MREVCITDTAKSDIEFIATFLETNHSNKAKVNFLVKLSEKLLFVEKAPFMYPASPKNPQIRRCVVQKNVICFYEVSDTTIYVLSVLDSRQDPENNKF